MNYVESIEELKLLSDEGLFKKSKIEWWLLKYSEDYQLFENDVFTPMRITYRADAPAEHKEKINLLNELRTFVNTYKVLDKVSVFYRAEAYFKEEVVIYNKIKNDSNKLKTWLVKQKFIENDKYSEFENLFQDNRTLSGYKLDVLYPLGIPIKITLQESDFKHTLQYLKVLNTLKK